MAPLCWRAERTPVYHLFAIGYEGHEVFIGSFSTLEKALEHEKKMHLHRRRWVLCDDMNTPSDEDNIVWEVKGTDE